jgi:TolA-binding protein
VGDMNRTSSDPPDGPALAALTELGRQAVKAPSAAALEHGLNALRARIVARASRRRALLAGSVLGVAAALLLGAGLRLTPALQSKSPSPVSPSEPPPVTVSRIEGGSLLDGGYLSESGHTGIKLSFNEGTTFVLTPGTRGRLRAIEKNGAHLAIENGAASFEVTRNPARHWSVEAGPFLVTVKGTVFTVSWDVANERFELNLRRGRVDVSGPVVGGSLSLRAGQRLVVRLPQAESVISEDLGRTTDEPVPGPEAPVDGPARPSPKKHERAHVDAAALHPAKLATQEQADRRWPALLAAGEWDQILAVVDRDGAGVTLENAPSEDLFALADAARYRRRIDLARAALLAHRRRFPSSPRSLDAIFLLGRVAELREGGAGRAIDLYDEYLARAPRGAYAAEALGRKMVLTNERGGRAQARPIADEYLLRFPDGSYAGSARALTRAP